MRLRGAGQPDEPGDDPVDEIIENPNLAPNLMEALKATFLP